MSNKNERRRLLRQERNAKGLCAYCGISPKVPDRIGCEDCGRGLSKFNSEWSKSRSDRTAIYRKRTRWKAISKYGGKCACCGESELLFLTIDHINGDGLKDRQKWVGTAWYMELLRADLRTDLQVLCYNCNNGREVNGGVCPHHNQSPTSIWDMDLRHVKRFNLGTKYNWPEDSELLELYQRLGATRASASVGCTPDALVKRIRRRGFPSNKERKSNV